MTGTTPLSARIKFSAAGTSNDFIPEFEIPFQVSPTLIVNLIDEIKRLHLAYNGDSLIGVANVAWGYDCHIYRFDVISLLASSGHDNEWAAHSDQATHKSPFRVRLFELAEFLIERDKSEDWLVNAEIYYQDYAERTSNLRANLKLGFEILELGFKRYWKPFAGVLGFGALWETIGRLSGK